MITQESLADVLPHPRPAEAATRLLLFGIRRMGANGLHDAGATHAFMASFGIGFRRPLILLRALMAELSGASANAIRIAPCCCPRMTAAEGALIDAIATAAARPMRSALLIGDLLGLREAHGPTATAQALAAAFADAGMPLAR